MSFFNWIQSFLPSSSPPKQQGGVAPIDIVAWARSQEQNMQPRLIADAFGGSNFNSEADLDRSQMLQRERRTKRGMIDFTDPRDQLKTKCVSLLGGPYDGQKALVVAGTSHAWVIGNWEYLRIENSDTWYWCHDDEA